MSDSLNENLPGKRKFLITIALILIIITAAAVLLLSTAGTSNSKGSIIFNEVVSGNSQPIGIGEAGSPDWIELYNSSSEDIDLSGYRLTDNNRSAGTRLDNAVIKKGGYLVIYAEKGYVPKDSGTCFVNFGISSSGETLYLLSPGGSAVAELNVPALYTDISYARKEDGTYGFCTETTPGSQNSEKIMNEDELKTLVGNGALVLSEVLPKASGGEAWAEVYNPGDSDIYLGNYCLTDTGSDKTKWHFPGQMLEPGEYAAVDLSGAGLGKGGMNASFKLGGTDSSIYLYDVTGLCLGSFKWDKDMPGGISVLGDGLYTAYPTKGEKNSEDTLSSVARSSMDNSDPVRINEVLPINEYSVCDADGDRCEWAEIYNPSDSSISLKGYFLSDDENDLFKWAFPDIVIEQNSYKIVFLSGKQGKEGELNASFRLSAGEKVYLTNITGMRTDSLTLPETIGENVSAGRDESGKPEYYTYPTPGSKNAEGLGDPSLSGSFNSNGLYISEVCAANEPLSNENDWIELYNGSGDDIDLTGYGLSGSDGVKWTIPEGTIKPKDYFVVETSAGAGAETDIAGFGISPSGETIALYDPDGRIIDVFESGVLQAGITSGRIDNDRKRVFFDAPTRDAKNSGERLSGYVQKPYFSETGLYKSKPFELSISCDTPGAKIYYTTDGSMPDKNSARYTAPVTISSNTPVRAAAYADGLLPSSINTATYLFNAPHTLPVFCINGEPSEVNEVIDTNNRSYSSEFAVNVEYFETDGTLGVSFPSGFTTGGRASIDNPQNSLRIRLRGAYGQKNVVYPFFDDCSITSFTTLNLRNSGQDNKRARIRDSFFNKLYKGLNIDIIETKLVVAYVNGEYYGLFDLDEKQNMDYLISHYGVKESDVEVVYRNDEEVYGSTEEFLHIRKIARTWDLADDKVFAEFAKYVDVDSCIDYVATQIYFGNRDVINQKFWRTTDYSHKWRPLLYDLDWSMEFRPVIPSLPPKSPDVFNRYFFYSPKCGDFKITYQDIFCGLVKNKAWREKFINRFFELAYTQFSDERVFGIYDEMVAQMEPEMVLNIQRFGRPKSMEVWHQEIQNLRDAIAQRRETVFKQLKKWFKLSDAEMQTYIDRYKPKGQ